MNASSKLRWANILTALASIIAVVQTMLTSPPFTPEQVILWGTVFTYLTLAATSWKQYLSPEVSNTGAQVTLWMAVAITAGGLVDILGVFKFSDKTAMYVKWGITVLVAVINILSKQIFPSASQKSRVEDLKLDR